VDGPDDFLREDKLKDEPQVREAERKFKALRRRYTPPFSASAEPAHFPMRPT
jgi:hypothetical protein